MFSLNIFQRTKSKSEQDEWFAALRDAKNTNQTLVGHNDYRKSSAAEMHCRPSHVRMSVAESRFNNHGNVIVQESYHSRGHYGKPMKESYDGVFYEVSKIILICVMHYETNKNTLHDMVNYRTFLVKVYYTSVFSIIINKQWRHAIWSEVGGNGTTTTFIVVGHNRIIFFFQVFVLYWFWYISNHINIKKRKFVLYIFIHLSI